MKLRTGKVADSPQVASVFQMVRATMQYLPVLHSSAETERYFGQQLSEHASLLALRGDAIVGFAIFGDSWLLHLYVSERRQGIGSALLKAVMAQSEAGLQLWTFQSNADAQRFYSRHGFVAVEATDGRGNEEQLPDVRYQWSAT